MHMWNLWDESCAVPGEENPMARCIIAGVFVTYVLAVFQTALGERLSVWGVSPDLLFVWSVCVGLLGGPRAGTVTGFGAGLIEGGLQQAWIGPLAISKSLSGFGAGLLATKMFKENWLVPIVCAALLTLVNEAMFLVLSQGAGWQYVGRLVGVRVVYHALLAPIGFALVSAARRSLVGQRVEVG